MSVQPRERFLSRGFWFEKKNGRTDILRKKGEEDMEMP